MAEPDAVLLVSGGTNGMLEVCDCPASPMLGLSGRAGLFASYRRGFDRTLVIDVGDALWVEPLDSRNPFVLRGYAHAGYEALVMGDQEWAVPRARIGELFARAEFPLISTNIRSRDPQADPPLTNAVKRSWGDRKLAVVSWTPKGAFWFVDDDRTAELDIRSAAAVRERIEKLHAAGYAVILAYHGSRARLSDAAGLGADLILHGHHGKTAEGVARVDGVPVVQVGGWETVAAVALELSPGAIDGVEFRSETVDAHWPKDPRMMELYRSYLRQSE
jgi:2',3'-cyclic-nucleotide 2'-phosphodiesterase (5'-nucleotidase family)